jgi:opacity protein-like surface antigen
MLFAMSRSVATVWQLNYRQKEHTVKSLLLAAAMAVVATPAMAHDWNYPTRVPVQPTRMNHQNQWNGHVGSGHSNSRHNHNNGDSPWSNRLPVRDVHRHGHDLGHSHFDGSNSHGHGRSDWGRWNFSFFGY